MFFCQILTVLILLFVNSRVLFLHHLKKDTFVMLCPLCIILSVLLFLAGGTTNINIFILILSLMTTILNTRALIRYSEKLFIDIYSPLMKVSSIILALVTLFSLIVTIISKPVGINSKKLGVEINTEKYQGSFRTEFINQTAFAKANAEIIEIAPVENKKTDKIIIFVPDIRGDVYSYIPYLQYLAKEGYTILTGDFYTSDCTWFSDIKNSKIFRRYSMIKTSLETPEVLNETETKYIYNHKLECNALVKFANQKYGQGCKKFLIGDGLSARAIEQYVRSSPNIAAGSFSLDSISEYKSSGYGCVEQTNPHTAKKLGLKKDKTLFITKYLVLKSKTAIQEAFSK